MEGELIQRREFLRGTAWMGAVAAAAVPAVCASAASSGGGANGAASHKRPSHVKTMAGFAAPPLKTIRLAFIGIGSRGSAAVRRISRIPGCEIAVLADLRQEAVDQNQKWLRENVKKTAPRTYAGTNSIWMEACDDPGVDVMYICAPAYLHARMALYAMKAGKHVLVEVPAAGTIDDCWAIVETSEKLRRHCMMLENCCYGELELLAYNLCHKGILGRLSHAEGAYIHNLTERNLENSFRNRSHSKGPQRGNPYPTHPLGPLGLCLDINRGDKMDAIACMSSRVSAWSDYIPAAFGPDDWQSKIKIDRGDMSTSIIRTARGRTIMLQYDTSTPRPYSRINLVQGSRGCFWGYGFPARLALAKGKPGTHADWMNQEEFDKYAEKYRHPLWKSVGEVAKKVGGHGGMDFIMDLRWAYCLQNGLPLDMDVYDLASWSSIVQCSMQSDRSGGAPVEIPDFTRGAWKTAKPCVIGDVDLSKMGLDASKAIHAGEQLSV